jgi:hypothetical protein
MQQQWRGIVGTQHGNDDDVRRFIARTASCSGSICPLLLFLILTITSHDLWVNDQRGRVILYVLLLLGHRLFLGGPPPGRRIITLRVARLQQVPRARRQ